MALMSVVNWPWRKIVRVLWYILKAIYEALKENEEEPLAGPRVKRADRA